MSRPLAPPPFGVSTLRLCPSKPLDFLALSLLRPHNLACRFIPAHDTLYRYEKYKAATTVAEYLTLGGLKADLKFDHSRGYLILPNAEGKFVDKSQDQGPGPEQGQGGAAAAPASAATAPGAPDAPMHIDAPTDMAVAATSEPVADSTAATEATVTGETSEAMAVAT